MRSAILVDQVFHAYESQEELFKTVKEHITKNLIKVGNGLFRQVNGIPQGSVLSTILCRYYKLRLLLITIVSFTVILNARNCSICIRTKIAYDF